MSILKKISKILIPVFLLFAFLFQPLSVVHAQSAIGVLADPFTGVVVSSITTKFSESIGCFTSFAGFSDCIFKSFADFIQWINTAFIGNLIWIVAGVIDIVLQFTTFANNPAVVTGWTIMRDFANMFFILIMLWISILIILDLQGDAPNKLLVWVIIIAVLINFSRVIAFVVIDFSHVFLNAFLRAFTNAQGQIDIAGYLGSALQIQMLVPPQGASVASAGTGISYGGLVATVLFHSVLLLIILMALIAAVFLFIVRMLALWAIIMLAPLAFIGRILPARIKAATWDRWWPALFSWSFVAPIYMFFIYITVKVAGPGGAFTTLVQTQQTSVLSGVAGANTIPFVNNMTVANLLTMVVAVGFLIMGLKLSLSLAGTAGNTAMSLGTKAMSAVGGGIAWGTRKGAAAVGRAAEKRYKEHAENSEKKGEKPNFAYTLGVGALARMTAGAQVREKEDVEERKSELKKKYGDDVLALQNKLYTTKFRPGPLGNKERAAIIAALGELPGGMSSKDPYIQEEIKRGALSATRLGFRPKSRPDLAALDAKTDTEKHEKINGEVKKVRAKDKDMETLSVDAFKGDFGKETTQAALRTWSGAHMAALYRANDEVFDHLKDSLLAMGNTAADIEAEIKRKIGAKKDGWGLSDKPEEAEKEGKKIIDYIKSTAGQDALGIKS